MKLCSNKKQCVDPDGPLLPDDKFYAKGNRCKACRGAYSREYHRLDRVNDAQDMLDELKGHSLDRKRSLIVTWVNGGLKGVKLKTVLEGL